MEHQGDLHEGGKNIVGSSRFCTSFFLIEFTVIHHMYTVHVNVIAHAIHFSVSMVFCESSKLH